MNSVKTVTDIFLGSEQTIFIIKSDLLETTSHEISLMDPTV